MSKPLNLAAALLAYARNLFRLGRRGDAFVAFSRLAAMPALAPAVAAESYRALAEIHIDRRHYRKARQAVRAALAAEPDDAAAHHLFALADDRDPRGNPRRALKHYRRAVELDPARPGWMCDYGQVALRLDRTVEALTALRKAAELAPNDADILEWVADGLAEAGEMNEAAELLRAARFRNPRNPQFETLWNRFRFFQARAEQQPRASVPLLRPFTAPEILPFDTARLPDPRSASGGGVLRFDAAARPKPHFGRRAARRDP
jgi:tetratricopeptide (TPR) repeat protein